MTRYRPCRYCGQDVKIITEIAEDGRNRYAVYEDLEDERVSHNCIAKSRRSPRHPETLADIEGHFLEQEQAQ